MKKLILAFLVLLAMWGCQSQPTQPVRPTLAIIVSSSVQRPSSTPDVEINFKDPPDGWCDAASYDFGDFYCQENEPHMIEKGEENIAAYYDNQNYKNFYLQVQMRLSGETGAYGVVFRDVNRQSDAATYIFAIRPDGHFRLDYWSTWGSRTLIPWTESSAIKLGEATNLIEVSAQGSDFTFFINDQQVATYSDNKLKEGTVGPVALDQAHAIVNSIKVWKLP